MIRTEVQIITKCEVENYSKCAESLSEWKPIFCMDKGTRDAISHAANLLRNGKLVSFPTETVYGLGANGLALDSVHKIYEAKRRPSDNPVILHISSLDMLSQILPCSVSLPKAYLEVVNKFWPGPLTIIVPKGENVPMAVSGGLNTVGVRFPSNPVALALISACGFPIAAPSANQSGSPSPTNAQHVLRDMDGIIPLILDGGQCEGGIESTVLDAYTAIPPAILRPGKLGLEHLGAIKSLAGIVMSEKSASAPRAPGMKYRHYSPNAKVVLFEVRNAQPEKVNAALLNKAKELLESNPKIKIGILKFKEEEPLHLNCRIHLKYLFPTEARTKVAFESASYRLFSALRDFDDLNVDTILVESIPEIQEGYAIMNRIRKAASCVQVIAT